jgi:hypothetical protein
MHIYMTLHECSIQKLPLVYSTSRKRTHYNRTKYSPSHRNTTLCATPRNLATMSTTLRIFHKIFFQDPCNAMRRNKTQTKVKHIHTKQHTDLR